MFAGDVSMSCTFDEQLFCLCMSCTFDEQVRKFGGADEAQGDVLGWSVL